MEKEKTLVLLKPDALQRRLMGVILSRIENKGLNVVGIKMTQLDSDVLSEHYSHIKDRPFFGPILDFMKSSPVVAICVEGIGAVNCMREMAGVTLAREARPGTIRGDFAMSVQCNLIHTSDSKESAKAEVSRFFDASDIFEYNDLVQGIIYSTGEIGK